MTLPRMLLVVILGAAAGCASSVDDVRAAIADRLALMDDVARFKWNADLPVADERREALLLEELTATAVEQGLDRAYAQRVLEAQMAAARLQQERLIERWREQGADRFDDVPDLATVQRPAITATTVRLITTLRDRACELARSDSAGALGAAPANVQPDVWRLATAALFPTPPNACDRH